MKISASKKQLAKIISENGGWFDGATWAAQDKIGFMTDADEIAFYAEKPDTPQGRNMWNADNPLGDMLHSFASGGVITNWHQTALHRDEYFYLHPEPDSDGWIVWNGGECPVERGTLIDVKHRNKEEYIGVPALGRWNYAWLRSGINPDDIIAYRLHKPEQARPEFCESVMRSIPEPEIHSKNTALTQVDDIDVVESKPTIEQLAAEYRNAKDYAERKQAEANDAKDDADSKLAELVAAGKALGLVLSVDEPQPELVITDHRDLLVGDEIKVIGFDGDIAEKQRCDDLLCADSCTVVSQGERVEIEITGKHSGKRCGWLLDGNVKTKWLFIHRP